MNLFAELIEGMRIAGESIRGNLLRSVLTTLGIVIGIVTVTLMASAIEALDRSFRNAMSFLSSDVLYVDKRQWFIASDPQSDAAGKRRNITRDQVAALERGLSGVQAVAPTVMHHVDTVRFGNRSSGMITVIGTTEQFAVTGGVSLAAGRFFTRAEAEGNRDICVVGAEIAEKLFGGGSPLGQKLRAGTELLEIVGVLEKRGSFLGQISLDNQLIIPIGKMYRGFRTDWSCTIDVKVGDAARLPAAKEEVRALMRKIRKVPPGVEDDFAINHQEQLFVQIKSITAVIATCGFFITGLSLFVGGIGIANVMFVSVAERTAEIGVRKALGAKRRTILLQFLIEASALCLIGGLIGLTLAAGLVGAVHHFYEVVVIAPSAVVLAIAVSIITGVIAGFLPAWRASRLSPVEALRESAT
jgi:putative ABC transport system permease protein